MNKIKQDKYILGQSESKDILNSGDEIQLDLTLKFNKDIYLAGVYGNVKDSNNNPIENALIKIMTKDYKPLMHTTTDLNGIYSIVNLPPNKEYNIFTIAKGMELQQGNLFSLGDNENKEINFILNENPSMKLGIIAGHLTVVNTNNPIKGAIISLYKIESDNLKTLIAINYTNEYGQYVFRKIHKGDYSIYISALGFTDASINSSVSENGEIISLNTSLEESNMFETGTISGTIINENNEVIKRADVILYSVNTDESLVPIAFTKTNEHGVYLFGNVPKGTYKVKANELEVSTTKTNNFIANSSHIFRYDISKATLLNGAYFNKITNLVENLGGINGGEIISDFNVPYNGTYKLTFIYKCLSDEMPLNISINGKDFQKVYTLKNSNNNGLFSTNIFLNIGNNTIKFYSKTSKAVPKIGNFSLEIESFQ